MFFEAAWHRNQIVWIGEGTRFSLGPMIWSKIFEMSLQLNVGHKPLGTEMGLFVALWKLLWDDSSSSVVPASIRTSDPWCLCTLPVLAFLR